MQLAAKRQADIGRLPMIISDSESRLLFISYEHDFGSCAEAPAIFIYTSASHFKIKDYMLYMALRANVLLAKRGQGRADHRQEGECGMAQW